MEHFASFTGARVSAVIPTRSRPGMVVDAVRSALAQTAALLEVIVVIDGPDAPTLDALEALEESAPGGRLRILPLDTPVGGAEARNLGVRLARGDWIAFLDDDDLWLPNKLAVQMHEAETSTARQPVIASAVLARGPHLEAIWPRRLYKTGEPMAEYLFCREGSWTSRTSWTYGAALLQTSTLLAPRELLLRVPFEAGLKKHQDWDWLLRVSADPAVEILQIAQPLTVFHVEGNRASTGRSSDWEFSQRWALERRVFFTPRAFAAFLATECAPQAARAGASPRQRLGLLLAVVREGSPHLKLLLLCLTFLLVPQRLRRLLRGARPPTGPSPVSRPVIAGQG